ncbi:hypothetical protein GPECTOR_53g82 [Gonium pectorale]|uniref:Cwf19-like C-terminal domain-containing protein n=1 Tax=Gonium pectorale TaxID=33097 RepID=A0A150G6U6_GONPE|nr:hypothetical protein GPECTOR_53g82 [Gonium pectorale]|eukprot:KXZ45589.1 hypothetical protein GPECTOR_53g82 [Gonium pectorale]
MTKPMRREAPKLTAEEEEDKQRQEAAAAEPEIFPGLRIMKKADTAAADADGARAPAPEQRAPAAATGAAPGRPALAGIGDGGASWRLKALRRAQEQAKAEGRSLHEVVGERWGSLAALTEGLSSTAAADGRAHLRAAAERRRAGGDGSASGIVPHYLQDVKSDRAQMLRPSDDASLRWRRDGREGRDGRGGARQGDGGDRDRGAEAGSSGRARDATAAGEGGARGDSDGGRGRDGDRDRGHRRDREEDQGRREPDRDRDRDQGGDGEKPRERDSERTQDRRERDRPDHGRGADRERERERTHGRELEGGRDRDRDRDRDRERDWGRERGRGAERRGGPESAAGPRPSREQAAALKQLAGSLNAFSNDGSFMKQFMASQGADVKEEADGDDRARRAGSGEPSPRPMDADGSDRDEPRGGPRSEQAAGPSAGAASGGGGGNRDIAAMLRGRGGGERAPAAGAGGGDRDDDGGERGAPAPRRAPLFVADDDGGAGGSGRPAGPSVPSGASGGDGGAGSGLGNKSAAELLRARLKGLPPPPIAAAEAAAVKREPGDGDGEPGPGPRSQGQGSGAGAGGSGPRREVVQLPLVDSSGRAVRGAFGREAAGSDVAPNAGRRAGTKPPQRYNRETGEKERYFADDDKVDLQTMLRRAKYGDDDMNMDEHLAANIAKKRKFRGTDLDVDAEYDFDGGIEMYESRNKRGNADAQKARDRNRQVADLRRQATAEAGCPLCVSNPKRPAHLTVAVGTAAYLCLPHRGRLVRGHCCIAPAEHAPSIRGLDEVAWTEGQSVLFMETYMTRGGGRHHAVLDAVPVTERQLEKARGYFKKAILEAESEWSTHHAKACIETTAQKGLRESIPPNFPYFYVQFGYGSGYVHVIDDESKFDPNFGRQVLIGLLDLPPEMAHQRQKSESAAAQQQWVREFESAWDPYDWTRQLHAA